MRVAFLFNHYAGHQLLHAMPIAAQLSRRYPKIAVRVIVSDTQLLDIARRLAARYEGHRCDFVVARVPRLVEWVDPVVRSVKLIRKNAVLHYNKALFREFDVLVVPEKTSLKLKKEPSLGHLRFVYTHHGAGDRAEAFYPELAEFDLVLAAGRKIRDRVIRTGLVDAERCRIVGYPKFEVSGALSRRTDLFGNGKPTVLYNPHFERAESSWLPMGKAVLDFFKHDREYNLIFAPHVVLYQRKWRHGARSLRQYRGLPNIHIDTGSLASIDMAYTAAADIYLGDVSSQVYEFLQTPRPCVFLNAHNVEGWERKESYQFWRAGEVVGNAAALPDALARAREVHGKYLVAQKLLFSDTFDVGEVPASARAADTIAEFFGMGRPVATEEAEGAKDLIQ